MSAIDRINKLRNDFINFEDGVEAIIETPSGVKGYNIDDAVAITSVKEARLASNPESIPAVGYNPDGTPSSLGRRRRTAVVNEALLYTYAGLEIQDAENKSLYYVAMDPGIARHIQQGLNLNAAIYVNVFKKTGAGYTYVRRAGVPASKILDNYELTTIDEGKKFYAALGRTVEVQKTKEVSLDGANIEKVAV